MDETGRNKTTRKRFFGKNAKESQVVTKAELL
jgi:hypothetical protein